VWRLFSSWTYFPYPPVLHNIGSPLTRTRSLLWPPPLAPDPDYPVILALPKSFRGPQSFCILLSFKYLVLRPCLYVYPFLSATFLPLSSNLCLHLSSHRHLMIRLLRRTDLKSCAFSLFFQNFRLSSLDRLCTLPQISCFPGVFCCCIAIVTSPAWLTPCLLSLFLPHSNIFIELWTHTPLPHAITPNVPVRYSEEYVFYYFPCTDFRVCSSCRWTGPYVTCIFLPPRLVHNCPFPQLLSPPQVTLTPFYHTSTHRPPCRY